MIKISGGRVRRHDKRIWFVMLGVFAAVFLFTFLTGYHKAVDEDVEAASLAGFDPGYIISDWQMGNYNSMTESEIQAFLTAKNPCNNTDYGTYVWQKNAYPNIEWHFENGHFVCISEERFGDGETIGSGDTAAHIIWQAAQDYKINPKVIIVLLQKEQGLITDSWPNNRQYRSATGYGCPDTAACSSKYYGFKNQVRNAAALFRTVLNGGWTNYPLGNNYIQYNPNADCGGSVVNIRSLATSALYRYTPYQPNAGAIAAGYGTAYCGAYGNRNFYLYYQDWFGGITDEDVIKEATSEHKQTTVEGLYQIIPKDSLEEALGINESLSSSKASLMISKNTRDDKQIFKIIYDNETGFYSIVSGSNGLSFDVKGEGTDDGTMLQLWTKKNPASCNQQWLLLPDEEGYLSIVSRCSSKGVSKDGNTAVISRKNSKWLLKPVSSGVELDDGVYSIKANSDLLIGSTGSDLRANIRLNNNNGDEQLFRIQKESGFYILKNLKTGRVIDVAGASVLNRANIQIYDYNGSCNQKWNFVKKGDKYILQSACTGKVMDVAGGNVVPLSNIQLYQYNGGPNQEWSIEKKENGLIAEDTDYQLISSAIEKAMDIQGGIVPGMSRGEMIVWSIKQTDYENQVFRFKYDYSNDFYYIYNPASGLYLDVSGAGIENDTKTILYRFNGNCNQQWRVKYEEQRDEFVISSVCSDKVLTVSNQLSNSSHRVTIFEKDKNDKQYWKLVKK